MTNYSAEKLREFSVVVEAIYDASIEPTKWLLALEKIASITGTDGCSIHFTDTGDPGAFGPFSYGLPEKFVYDIFSQYQKVWTSRPRLLDWDVGNAVHLPEVLPLEDYRKGHFYQKLAKPQGYFDFIGMIAFRNGTHLVKTVNARNESHGSFSADDVAMFRLLAPHISKAAAISDALEMQRIYSATLEQALDRLRTAVYLTAEDGRVVYMNPVAQGQHSQNKGLQIVDGRLDASDRDASAQLAMMLAGTASSHINYTDGVQAIALKGSRTSRLIANVLPLRQGRLVLGEERHATAAVFVQDPTDVMPLPGNEFGKLYGLTPAELRVALTIARGHAVQEASELLNVSADTVKTHLQRVFSKTATKRQSDLVSLIARFVPAVLARK
jgi:DNA-binding CsgD family transcriptional regulator